MRFNNQAYDKLFPRQKPKEVVETAVETFTPTTDEQEETDVDEVVEVEGGEEDGNGCFSDNDSE